MLNGGNVEGFGFDVVGITRVYANEITVHLMRCMAEKIGREQFKIKARSKI